MIPLLLRAALSERSAYYLEVMAERALICVVEHGMNFAAKKLESMYDQYQRGAYVTIVTEEKEQVSEQPGVPEPPGASTTQDDGLVDTASKGSEEARQAFILHS